MHPESGISNEANGMAVYARVLNSVAAQLQHRPDLVYQVLEGIEATVRSLDDVIEAAAASYRAHAGTAVTIWGDDLAGTTDAVHIGGYLAASAQTTRTLAALLMRATAEAEQIAWPEHNPVAADRLASLREQFDHRAEQLSDGSSAHPTSAARPGRETPKR